jgi:hypothetical protein
VSVDQYEQPQLHSFDEPDLILSNETIETLWGLFDNIGIYWRNVDGSSGMRSQWLVSLEEPPTGERFEVDYDTVYPIIDNPTTDSYAEGTERYVLNPQFNRAYSMMLTQIEEAMGGEPRVLYTAIKNGMHHAQPAGPRDDEPTHPQ